MMLGVIYELLGPGSRVLENVSMWPRDQSCDILVKNVAVFCSCMESLPETKVKSFGLILLTEEI